MASRRPERVADLVHGVLARVVRDEMRDPRLGFVTLTAVALSPDLKHARVFVSLLGSREERTAAVAVLNRASTFWRRRLAGGAGLRHTPNLVFVEDESLEQGSRVERILKHVHEKPGPADDSGDTP